MRPPVAVFSLRPGRLGGCLGFGFVLGPGSTSSGEPWWPCLRHASIFESAELGELRRGDVQGLGQFTFPKNLQGQSSSSARAPWRQGRQRSTSSHRSRSRASRELDVEHVELGSEENVGEASLRKATSPWSSVHLRSLVDGRLTSTGTSALVATATGLAVYRCHGLGRSRFRVLYRPADFVIS